MIKFIYSEKANKVMLENYWPKLKPFCEKHNLVYFEPNESNKALVDIFFKTYKFPEIEGTVDCYIRYFGPWGMYHPEDNTISICPIKIEKAPGGLVGVVKHELLHLQHPEANQMETEEKEKYIESLEI